MTDCHIMADRMPAVAHGRATWRPAELAHLSTCAGCALEWKIVCAAHAEGMRATARLDARRIADAVRQRLGDSPRAESRLPRTTWWLAGLAAAAAIVLMVYPRPSRNVGNDVAPSTPAVSVLHELDQLTSSELESVLESIPASAASMTAPHSYEGGLDDLAPAELERVLHSLEG